MRPWNRAMHWRRSRRVISSGCIRSRWLLEKLEGRFEEEKEGLVQKLELLVKSIFRPENFMMDYVGEEKGYQGLEELVQSFRGKLFTDPVEKEEFRPVLEKKNEGYLTSAQVQYVCRAGNFIRKGLPYTGALKVLKVMMGYDYLWNRVRVKGGAYGCMCSFGKSGDSYFVSYRDPNLEKTVDVYEKAAEYVEGFEADERTMTQFVIGAISELDVPMTPAAKGLYSLTGYMTKLPFASVQREREELLAATPEDIRGLAGHIRAFMGDDCLCVVGSEEKLKEREGMFGKLEQLFH